MRRYALAFSLLFVGCASSAPAGPATDAHVELGDLATADEGELPDPVARYHELVRGLDDKALAKLEKLEPEALEARGLDENLMAEVARRIFAACLSEGGRCDEAQNPAYSDPRAALVLALLPKLASRRSLSLLTRLQARTLVDDRHVEWALRRTMGQNLGPCDAPAEDAVARMEESLSDFAVIERVGTNANAFVAREATERERSDLAYFLVAIEHAGPVVGTVDEQSATRAPGASKPSAADAARRTELQEQAEAARKDGDWPGVYTHSLAYLESLGYPGPLRASDESIHSWGGARFSYVMRDFAYAAEVTGQTEEAAGLYRRANPGGGACGTSTDYRRGRQTRGLIRATEQFDGCRTVVAERLLDWDGGDYTETQMSFEQRARMGYGPERLAAAGFDVARLYRGALVTRNRHIDEAKLRAAIDRGPASLRTAAERRLLEHGPEAWEYRVRALEGLADESGRDGVETVLTMLPDLDDELRTRGLTALGELGFRHHMGPCGEGGWMRGFGMSNIWHRRVSPFADACEDAYDDDEADAVADKLLRWVRSDQSVDVRLATLEALRQLLSPKAEGRVKALQRRAHEAATQCEKAHPRDESRCWNKRAVADHAKRLLETYVDMRS